MTNDEGRTTKGSGLPPRSPNLGGWLIGCLWYSVGGCDEQAYRFLLDEIDHGHGDDGNERFEQDLAANDGGDYGSRGWSPCVNSGNPASAPATDLEGTPSDAKPDMGAYEWVGVMQDAD